MQLAVLHVCNEFANSSTAMAIYAGVFAASSCVFVLFQARVCKLHAYQGRICCCTLYSVSNDVGFCSTRLARCQCRSDLPPAFPASACCPDSPVPHLFWALDLPDDFPQAIQNATGWDHKKLCYGYCVIIAVNLVLGIVFLPGSYV